MKFSGASGGKTEGKWGWALTWHLYAAPERLTIFRREFQGGQGKKGLGSCLFKIAHFLKGDHFLQADQPRTRPGPDVTWSGAVQFAPQLAACGSHYYFNRCFRCHDGQHVSADGKVVSKGCTQCHTLMSQTEGSISVAATAAPNFQHPVDIGDLTQVNCSDCHTGGNGP